MVYPDPFAVHQISTQACGHCHDSIAQRREAARRTARFTATQDQRCRKQRDASHVQQRMNQTDTARRRVRILPIGGPPQSFMDGFLQCLLGRLEPFLALKSTDDRLLCYFPLSSMIRPNLRSVLSLACPSKCRVLRLHRSMVDFQSQNCYSSPAENQSPHS